MLTFLAKQFFALPHIWYWSSCVITISVLHLFILPSKSTKYSMWWVCLSNTSLRNFFTHSALDVSILLEIHLHGQPLALHTFEFIQNTQYSSLLLNTNSIFHRARYWYCSNIAKMLPRSMWSEIAHHNCLPASEKQKLSTASPLLEWA